MSADERPLGDPFGEFAAATDWAGLDLARGGALDFLVGYVDDGTGLEEPEGRARLVALMAAFEAERDAAYDRITANHRRGVDAAYDRVLAASDRILGRHP